MMVDDLFQIAGEAAIQQRGGTARFGGGNDFGKQTARPGRNGGTHNRYGARFALDDDFRACANLRHQPGKIAGGIGLGDADHRHTHDDTPVPDPVNGDARTGLVVSSSIYPTIPGRLTTHSAACASTATHVATIKTFR